MAKKIIPGERKTGIIDIDTLEMLNKSIRNNYALFGDRANDIKAYCIRLKNLVHGEPINLDDAKVSRYTIKKDSDGELICKKDRVTKYPDVSIDPATAKISVRNVYDFNLNTNYIDKSESTDHSAYDDYIVDILLQKSSLLLIYFYQNIYLPILDIYSVYLYLEFSFPINQRIFSQFF